MRLPLEGSAAEQEGARTSKPESRQVEHMPLRIRKSSEGEGAKSQRQAEHHQKVSEPTHVAGILETKEKVRLFEEIIARNFPNLMKKHLNI